MTKETHPTELTPPVSRPVTETSIEALAYGLSHDIRARLRGAGGFLELARLELADGADVTYFLDRAAASVDLADRMTARLVRYLRIPTVTDGVSVDPADSVRTAAAALTDGPETIIDALPGVEGDPALLVNAVVEVLDNAARYRCDDESPVVRVSGAVEESWTVLRFADNGFGIAPDRVDKAFELFRQVHRVGDTPGSGMGLPIARRSIESQGGTLCIGPGSERGSVVEIRLPVSPPS